MIKLCNWLKEIELIASQVYKKSSQYFHKDAQLSEFLKTSSIEEQWHAELISDAKDYFVKRPDILPAIMVDKAIDTKIRNYFSEMDSAMKSGSLTRSQLFHQIVTAENSEWNEIFLYVIKSVEDKKFRVNLPRLQSHIESMEIFIEKHCDEPEIRDYLQKVPALWKEKVLLVDDDTSITELFESLLEDKVNVDIAYNGKEALKLFQENYYKLIISDIDMPVLDGISFYKEAKKIFTGIGKRLLFVSGDISDDNRNFFSDENLAFFEKPVNITDLYTKSKEILFN